MSRWFYISGTLLGGAVGFALLLDVIPAPFGPGLAFSLAVMVGRYMELRWPILHPDREDAPDGGGAT